MTGFQVGAFQTNFQQIAEVVEQANSGGWDIYAYHHRKRIKKQEDERINLEIAEQESQSEKATQNRKLLRLQKDIDLKIKQVQDLHERIDALLTLVYLEHEYLLKQNRRRTVALLLLAA
jgi:hypothetical protein